MNMNNQKKHIKFVMGTMTIGEQIFGNDVKEMLQEFLLSGYHDLDSAYVYNDGQCEQLLGGALKEFPKNSFAISTKANPRITGKLDKEAVITQCNTSLERLQISKADIFYLHFPDPNTPLTSALEGCAQLYEEGKFARLGLSNFPAWLVAETCRICEKNGWMLPEVYQGLYNPLSRHAEEELDRALDYYNISFYAYNPLAGGILTDKYSGKEPAIKTGRFTNRPNYQKRYWKDSYFEAAELLKKVCSKYNIHIVEAAYRWLAFHSMLKTERDDAIIVGASRVSQLKENLLALKNQDLAEEIVNAFNDAWLICQNDAPSYFRYYTPSK